MSELIQTTQEEEYYAPSKHSMHKGYYHLLQSLKQRFKGVS